MTLARLAIERAERVEKAPLRLGGLDRHHPVKQRGHTGRTGARDKLFRQPLEQLSPMLVEQARRGGPGSGCLWR